MSAEPSISFYLKDPHERERTLMTVEDSLELMSVNSLKRLVSDKTSIPPSEMTLLYNGRVLSNDVSIDHYGICDGVTIYYMRKACNKKKAEPETQLKRLLRNPRVHQIMCRVLSNPLLLSMVTRGTCLEDSPEIQRLASDPILRGSNISDPDLFIKMIENNPEQAAGIEAMLKSIGAELANERGCHSDQLDDEDIVEMLEQSVDEDMECLEGEDEGNEELAAAQDQMYQHSQSILAHQQSNSQSLSQPVQPTYNRQGITHNMLVSALASVSTDGGSSHPNTTTANSTTHSSIGTTTSSNIGTSGSSSGNTSGNTSGGTVTQLDVQRALQSLVTTGTPPHQQPTSSAHDTHHRSSSSSSSSSRHRRYHVQLQQLRGMGLTDDRASLYVLDATRGDVNAALELLLNADH